MNNRYKIGDIVEDIYFGICEIITEGTKIQYEDKIEIAYVATAKGEKFCVLEKDLK